jgi:hypothetical protein
MAGILAVSQLHLPVHAQELEQDPIVIRGEQANPKTMYVTPWKRIDRPLQPGPLPGSWQADHRPVDRDVFTRELDLQLRGYSVRPPGDPGNIAPDVGAAGADDRQ